jgi:cytochrome c biogenesis protein CcmG, thiol:disulfide interchange protein DsbE
VKAPLWLALLLAALLAGCSGKPHLTADPATPAISSDAPAKGQNAPNFTLRAASGENVALADLRGKVVLVNFWATWCAPCKQELPAIDAVARRYAARGFVVLGVDAGGDQDSDVESFARKQALSFPLLEDSTGVTAARYRLLGVPTSFLVDANGIVRAVHPGPYKQSELDRAVRTLLGVT